MEEQWCPRREWGRGEERIWGIQQNFSSRHSSYILVCARVGVETPLSLFVVVILAPRLASLSIEVFFQCINLHLHTGNVGNVIKFCWRSRCLPLPSSPLEHLLPPSHSSSLLFLSHRQRNKPQPLSWSLPPVPSGHSSCRPPVW